MFNYTDKNINILSFIISILLFISINYIISKVNEIDFQKNAPIEEISEVYEQKIQEHEKNNVIVEEKNIKNKGQNAKIKEVWKIEIPVISLSAEISEGTGTEVMNKYVGHFPNTSKKDGNIGLAAHNRGYAVNYFKDIKKLKKGDEINYQCGKYKNTYIVNKILIINDTDWSKLEQTEDNVITLITCVENEPLYRRCIQRCRKIKNY